MKLESSFNLDAEGEVRILPLVAFSVFVTVDLVKMLILVKVSGLVSRGAVGIG